MSWNCMNSKKTPIKYTASARLIYNVHGHELYSVDVCTKTKFFKYTSTNLENIKSEIVRN